MNFPVLILSGVLERPDDAGRAQGRMAGLVSPLASVVLSPTVWVKIFGYKTAIFPYDHPAIVP